jgi:hypothetical protein
MNFKTTYVLFGALILVLGVFALTQIFGLKKPGESSVYVLPSLNKDTKNPTSSDYFDAVEIQRFRPTEEKYVFVRRDRGWQMERPYQLHADKGQVDELVRQVFGGRKDKDVTDMSTNLKEYELNSPATVVTLKKGADKEWKLNLGRESPGTAASRVVYVSSSDRPDTPMAVRRSELEAIFKTVADFRSKDLLEASAFNTSYLNLQQPKKDAIILTKNGEGKWLFEKPAYGDADYDGDTTPPPPGGVDRGTKPITGVKDLLEAVGNLRVESNADFGPPQASDSELTQFGLEQDRPSYLRIEIKRTPGGLLGGDDKKEPIQDALLIGNKIEDDKKADDKKGDDKKPAEKPDKRYARLESDKAVVKLSVKNLEPIVKVVENASILRNRNLVQIEQYKTDAIDIKNAGGLIKLRKPLATWKLFAGVGKGRTADDQAVQSLLNALTQKRQVQDFPDPAKEAEYGFDKPAAVVVSLWMEGLAKEEDRKDADKDKPEDKKDDAAKDKKDKPEERKDPDAEPKLKDAEPTVKLTFGKEEKDNVYVRREIGKDKIVLTVPKTLLAKVNQDALAYLDRTLPSFSETAEVTNLVLDRGGDIYEVDKEGTSWKLKKPQDLAGRAADSQNVDNIIRALRGLHTDKLVAESAPDLDKYGLKTPQLKATLKVKAKDADKPEDWVYFFGKETDDKTGVYAKQDRRDMIFVVRPDVLTTLRSELRDPTVLPFDIAKAKGMKLTGWKQAVGSTYTLDLERKAANTWTAKMPTDFALDNNQAETFLASLAGLKTDHFLADKAPLPEHKLSPKEATLVIEITVEGEKAPLTLTIGDLNAKDKAYYAQSSSLPNVVFTLPQDRFEKVLSGPKYFTMQSGAGK